MQIIYKLLREYEENTPNNEDYYDDYSDEDLLDKKQIRNLLKKISKNLPKTEKEKIDKDFLRQKYHPYKNNINQNTYAKLKKAFKELKTVEIEYFDLDTATFKKRKIDVYYTSAKYTIGYCHLRKAMRKFRTSRIKTTKITNSTYSIPKTFNKNDH